MQKKIAKLDTSKESSRRKVTEGGKNKQEKSIETINGFNQKIRLAGQ